MLARHFDSLDIALTQSQKLWKPRPFLFRQIPWQYTHPHIYRAAMALSNADIAELNNNSDNQQRWFATLEPELCKALYSWKPPQKYRDNKEQINREQFRHTDQVGIPGRKWQQVSAFAAALKPVNTPIVDWCSGKGHLARVLHRTHGNTVHCLEVNEALCVEGELFARKQGSDIQYHHCDVLKPLPEQLQSAELCHTGLHACGQLHIQLLQQACSNRAQSIAMSPCCYQLIADEFYQPMSVSAQKTALQLSKKDLHHAVAETVTAGARVKRQRVEEQRWRLAFDELQRDLRHGDEYLPLPSFAKLKLNNSFESFCYWAAEHAQITLPRNIAFDDYLERGEKRRRWVEKLEIVRQLFRRPLEYWLVLDRALYLNDNHYHSEISEFCPREITPRNLLIEAYRY